MPELIEVEMYRLDLDALIGCEVSSVSVNDQRAIRPRGGPAEQFGSLVGAKLRSTRRHGKLLLAQFGTTKTNEVLGLRFAMTGRLLIDGRSRIEHLEYSSPRNNPAWDRFEMTLDGHVVALRDQRCLGSVEMDPDLSSLAPEASLVESHVLADALAGRTKPIKAALLDQSILAGLGNLLADEVLYCLGIAPQRSVATLTNAEITQLAIAIRETVARLTATGGSNTGESFVARKAGAMCPSCGGGMVRSVIGGRTSWSCSVHQS